MNKAVRLGVVALLLLAGACQRPESPLAGAAIGGPFVLTDQDGRRFDSRTLAGRWPVIYFGYTFCPDVCPLDMQKLAKGLRAFEASDPGRAAKVQPVFITIDPARDTPAVLRQFVRAFHPRLIGLTGSEAEIAAVAKAYATTYRKVEPMAGAGGANGAAGYLMEHQNAAILFDPEGKPIALVPVDAAAPDGAAADVLAAWVR